MGSNETDIAESLAAKLANLDLSTGERQLLDHVFSDAAQDSVAGFAAAPNMDRGKRYFQFMRRLTGDDPFPLTGDDPFPLTGDDPFPVK